MLDSDYHTSEAARLTQLAANVITDIGGIPNENVRRAAFIAAKQEYDRYLEAARAELVRA